MGSWTRVAVTLVLVLVLVGLVLVSTSSFRECLGTYAYGNDANAFEKHYSAIRWCVGEFIDANGGVITAIAALVTAIFTGTLWWSTDKLWRTGERQIEAATTAANAAVASVNEFREKERARLVVTNARCQFGPKEDPGNTPKKYTITVAHQFLNYGATAAVLGDYKAKMFFGTKLPEKPASTGGLTRIGFFQTPLLSTQLGDVLEFTEEMTFTQDEWSQMQSDTPDGFKMFVVISVVSKDTFGTVRTTFFALKWKGTYFVPSGDDAYNYEHAGEKDW